MPQAKKPSKRKHRACAVPLLGAAGLSLSLASGAPAATAGPTAHEITLGEEEISDVSLATFYVFDRENVGPSQPGVQLVHRGCGGCRGCQRLQRLPQRLRRLPEAAEAVEAVLRFGGEVAAVVGGGAIE